VLDIDCDRTDRAPFFALGKNLVRNFIVAGEREHSERCGSVVGENGDSFQTAASWLWNTPENFFVGDGF
jgi:hypothetical protein